VTELAQLLLPAIRWDVSRGFDAAHESMDAALDLGVGGFIIFGGESEAVRSLTAELRARSRTPLLIGADLERGAGQQFAGAIGLPPLAAIASLGDTDAIRGAASLSAREARTLGINWIYAPVCDLDIEPQNPIVGTRSLGGNPLEVAAAAVAWIEECQAAGVLACAKHFPGHGRTTSDSHAELPVVNASAATLATTDLIPFQHAIDAGVAGVMTAHVAYPALDPSGMPATLSEPILGKILRDEMGFRGLVVTDALIMQGVLGGGESGAVVKALSAGCDLLLYPTDVAGCLNAIDEAAARGDLSDERLKRSIETRKRWAEWANSERKPASVTHDDLVWSEQLCDRAVHRLRGGAPALRDKAEIVIVDDDLGGPYPPPSRESFVEALAGEAVTTEKRDYPSGNREATVVIALFGDIRSWKGRPGYSGGALDRVRAALTRARAAGQDVVIVQFSHPRLAESLPNDAPILCAWGGESVMQRAAARVLASVRTTPSADHGAEMAR
jgi:beta-glucosidase-like glycosyl hydrolase